MSQCFVISSPSQIEAYRNGGVFPRRRCRRSRAYQDWAGFSEAADQFRGPTNLWNGNRHGQIHFQVRGKIYRVRPFLLFFFFSWYAACNFKHEWLLPLCWQIQESAVQQVSDPKKGKLHFRPAKNINNESRIYDCLLQIMHTTDA